LDGDVYLLKRANALELQITQEERTLNDIHSYMQYQTMMVCRVLANECMIYCAGDDWQFTHRGEIASHFAEVHPIPLTHLIIETNWFNGWNAQDLVCLLSVFVDVRVPEHMRTFEPASENERILKAIQLLKNKYEEIGDIERRENMHTGLTYGDGVLCYDLVDAMGIWCGLEDELDCKRFIQGENIAGLHISAGDFTKACMKVCAIANELGTMAESMMKRGTMNGTILELAHKLREVEKMVLKYVATTQSVYL
jgi:hypothetical protein